MFVFVDTETTGFARAGVQPRIVSIAWAVTDNPSTPRVFKRAIIRPEGFSIPSAAAAVHGISTEHASRVGLPIVEVLHDFTQDLRTLQPTRLIAHNLAYDQPVIEAEYGRTGMPVPFTQLARECTMMSARRRWPGESARLGDVHQRLFGSTIQNAHDAAADTWACVKVFFALRGNVADAALSCTKNASSIAPLPDEDAMEMVEEVLAWADNNPSFDTSFIESLRDRLETGRDLTLAQDQALRKIIKVWRIRE